jgi:hypothetical protein
MLAGDQYPGAPRPFWFCGDYAAANAQSDEVIALADEKGASIWKVGGMFARGLVLALTGKASDAIHVITSVHTAYV